MIKLKLNRLHFQNGKPALSIPFMYRFVRYSGISLEAEYYLFPFNLIERLRDRLRSKRKLAKFRRLRSNDQANERK